MGPVVIGMDPHKRSATIEIIDQHETVLRTGRFGTDQDGYQHMLAAGRHQPQRLWAVEGREGIGRHLAQRLVADGETVVDVPAKLSARARVFATGQGRKTDPADAHSVAVVAQRTKGLRAKKFLSAAQARALLGSVRPRDVVGRTRRRLAADLVTELERVDKQIKAANVELRELVADCGSTLMELTGIGPSSAVRLLGDVGDIGRFVDKGRFASWNGTAPFEASSGDERRHRLSRAGNRRINRVLHVMAIVQLRHDKPGRAYYRRRLEDGKTSMEAMRCLKRRLSDVVYQRMVRDARREAAGSGGHVGATTNSSAADLDPVASTSDKSLPEPTNFEDRTAASSTA